MCALRRPETKGEELAKDFYKSMTTHHDSTLWQDVYHLRLQGGPAYVKLQITSGSTVVIPQKG